MPQNTLSRLFREDINLNDLFEILSPPEQSGAGG